MKQGAGTFVFESYSLAADRSSVTFRYRVEGPTVNERFEEYLYLPEPVSTSFPDLLLSRLLFSLHLASGINYYKAFCPKEIRIESGSLDKNQAEFWDKLYTKGLGEFFYRNSIDFRGLVSFPSTATTISEPVTVETTGTVLLGIGGGKDSLVSAELLKKAKLPFTSLLIEKKHRYPILETIASEIGAPSLSVRRQLSPRLFELNKVGTVYNGHIPISAIYALIGVLAASLYGFRYFVVSNERSANIGNVSYLGMDVNHQWSKSSEFETMFQSYVASYLTPSVGYVSLLRPLSELHIVKLFAGYPRYFPLFSSCNRNFSIEGLPPDGRWCGKCPKCAFVFILLSAFLPRDTVMSIMGKNMLDDEALIPLYRGLLGWGAMKPFECVGTPGEVDAAFGMIHAMSVYDDTPVMKMYLAGAPHTTKEEKKAQYADLMECNPSGIPAILKDVYQFVSPYETE